MTTALLDDHLLLRVLLQDERAGLRRRGTALATTGLWYHRLCRALSNDAVTGSLSRRFGDVDPAVAGAVVRAVIELPDRIELVSMRTLAWPMGQLLAGDVRLNLLSLEALAAAQHLDAEICLATADLNEPLRDAAQQVSVQVRTID